MIADEVEERLVADEAPGTEHRGSVAIRLRLGDHLEATGAAVDGSQKRRFVPRPDDDGNLVGPRCQGLVHDDAERRSDHAIPVDEPLERVLLGGFPGGGDHGAAEIHGGSVGTAERPAKNRSRETKMQPSTTGPMAGSAHARRDGPPPAASSP